MWRTWGIIFSGLDCCTSHPYHKRALPLAGRDSRNAVRAKYSLFIHNSLCQSFNNNLIVQLQICEMKGSFQIIKKHFMMTNKPSQKPVKMSGWKLENQQFWHLWTLRLSDRQGLTNEKQYHIYSRTHKEKCREHGWALVGWVCVSACWLEDVSTTGSLLFGCLQGCQLSLCLLSPSVYLSLTYTHTHTYCTSRSNAKAHQ